MLSELMYNFPLATEIKLPETPGKTIAHIAIAPDMNMRKYWMPGFQLGKFRYTKSNQSTKN